MNTQLNLPDIGLCSEDLFWEKVAALGWGTVTTDYSSIQQHILATWTPEFTTSFRVRFDEAKSRLYKALTRTIQGVSDDGFDDLRAHIVGLGRETFEAVLADPRVAQKLVDEDAYVESFSYAIPYPPREAEISWEEFLTVERKHAEDYDEGLADEFELRRRYLSRTQGDWAHQNPAYHQLGAKSLVIAFEEFQASQFCTEDISKETALALEILRHVAEGEFEALTDNQASYIEAVKAVKDHMQRVQKDFMEQVEAVDIVFSAWPQNFGIDLLKYA